MLPPRRKDIFNPPEQILALTSFPMLSNLLTDQLTCSQTAVTNGNLRPDPPSEPWNQQKIPEPVLWSSASFLTLRHGKRGQPGGEARRLPD